MSKPRLSTLWFKDLELDGDKEELRDLILASNRVLERLNELVEEKEYSIIQEMKSKTRFKDTSWSNNTASLLGELRFADYIKDLIKGALISD